MAKHEERVSIYPVLSRSSLGESSCLQVHALVRMDLVVSVIHFTS